MRVTGGPRVNRSKVVSPSRLTSISKMFRHRRSSLRQLEVIKSQTREVKAQEMRLEQCRAEEKMELAHWAREWGWMSQ